MPNTVLLEGMPNIPQEKNATEAITPGHLVELTPTGLRKHATVNGNAQPWWARESLTPDRSAGGGAANPIDVAYQTGETVRWFQTRQGDVVYAIVPASSPAIVVGDDLCSNGDGTVKKNVPGSQGTNLTCIIGKAAEAVNNSGGTTAVRIRVISV